MTDDPMDAIVRRAGAVVEAGRDAARPRDTFPTWCKACGHAWTTPIRLPMEVRRFVKVIRAIVTIGCPKCGATGKDVLWDTRPKP